MSGYVFYIPVLTGSTGFAAQGLNQLGFSIASEPDRSVTHLLLPVPSFDDIGRIRNGPDLRILLDQLSPSVHIIGGKLGSCIPEGYRSTDLLEIPAFVAENAYITAHCTLRLILDQLPAALRDCPILIIGWGRIGKCLAALLKGLEAQVTVAARKTTDQAMLQALGYRSVSVSQIDPSIYKVVINTVPAMVLPESPEGLLKIDLASTAGMAGSDVIVARGLPGKYAPQTTGELIARTIAALITGKE